MCLAGSFLATGGFIKLFHKVPWFFHDYSSFFQIPWFFHVWNYIWWFSRFSTISRACWNRKRRVLNFFRKFTIPLRSSCPCIYFISCGCMLLITLNNDCTDESVAMLRPLWELLLIRFTKISTLLLRAWRNWSGSSSVSPFWYTWRN